MDRKKIWSKEALDLLEGILTYWDDRNGSGLTLSVECQLFNHHSIKIHYNFHFDN